MTAEADAPIERVLVIALDRLGDTLQACPTMQAVRERFPGARIDLLAVETYAAPLEGSPFHDRYLGLSADDVIAYGRAAEAALAGEAVTSAGLAEIADVLRGERYDLVVNLVTSTLGAWLTTVSAPRFNVGLYVSRERSLLVDGRGLRYFVAFLDFRDENPFNFVDMWRASVAEPRTVVKPRGYIARAAETRTQGGPHVVALNPGASRADRRWPLSSFARLADTLAADGVTAVLVGGPADTALCEAVRFASASKPEVVTGLTVPEMAAWFAGLGCVVSNDTGAMHIAAGANAKSVGIYGGFARYRETAPFGDGALLLEGAELPDVDVESVVAAVRLQLGRVDEASAKAVWQARAIDVARSRIVEDRPDSLGGARYEVLAERAPQSDDERRTRLVRALALATFPRRWIGLDVSADALRDALEPFGPSVLRTEAGEGLVRWAEALETTADRWLATTRAEEVLDATIGVLLKVEGMNVGQILGDGIAMLSRLLEWDLKMIAFEEPATFGEARAACLRESAGLARAWAGALLA